MNKILFLGVIAIMAIAFVKIDGANKEYLAKIAPEAQNQPINDFNPEMATMSEPCHLKDVVCEDEQPKGVESRIRKLAGERNFEDPELLVTLSKGESGLVEDRVSPINDNGTYDVGAFQINDCHACEWQIKQFGKAKEGCIKSEDRKKLEVAIEWTINKIRAGGLGIWVYARKAGLKFNA